MPDAFFIRPSHLDRRHVTEFCMVIQCPSCNYGNRAALHIPGEYLPSEKKKKKNSSGLLHWTVVAMSAKIVLTLLYISLFIFISYSALHVSSQC